MGIANHAAADAACGCADGCAFKPAAGLIADDAADSRATRIFITEAGRAAFETLWPHMAEAQSRMFRGIPADERRAFVGTLQKMLTNIRKHEI